MKGFKRRKARKLSGAEYINDCQTSVFEGSTV